LAKPRATADARALAWEILQRVDGGAYADALLGRLLTTSGLERRDQALVTQLVYGTLAWQGYLDHLIAAFSRRPPAGLDPPVRILLRLALFQICRLTKIPPFAAVNTAVDLAKQFRGGAARGLVNAVLRRAATEWRRVPLPALDADPIAHLAVSLSHPRWLVERWAAQYGIDDTAALLRANNEAAPTILRVNQRRSERPDLLAGLREAGYTVEPTVYSPVGIRIQGAGPAESLPGYHDGTWSVQGEASQLIGLLVAPQPGSRLLDACAAPGGKTTHLAELMDDRGDILALDPNARGLGRLQRMATRLGLSIIRVEVVDVLGHQALPTVDSVLVDAPCSGLGTLRAHPEIKWRRTPEDLAASALMQARLLRRVAECVRAGGTLVYSTCTLSTVENEDVLAAFLAERSDFRVVDPRPLLPENARRLIGADNIFRTYPHHSGLDGFFAARLQRAA